MKKNKRIISIVTIITIFLFPLIFVQAAESPPNSLPIMASPSSQLSQMETWAKKNNATSTFVSLARLYWDLSKSHGGIDPTVAYAQAAKETKFGNFGGVLDESFHNPCGLKTTQGGDDNDPNAHKRFDTWEQGVSAHLDHLALYAGAQGYPRSSTFDPRHFPSLFGKVGNFVEKLGSNWAPSPTYGIEIISMANSIQNTVPEKIIDNKICIDNPSQTKLYGDKDLYVSGWVLSSEGIREVNIYIDSNLIGKANYGIERTDVNNIFPGYPEGSNPGYSLNVKSQSIDYGKHNLTVKAIGNKGTVISSSMQIEKIKLDPLIAVDVPNNGASIDSKTEYISGWAISDGGIQQVQVFLNDQLIGNATYGVDRKDVDNAYQSYANGSKVGFYYNLDTSIIKTANNILKIKAISNKGETVEKSLTLKKAALSNFDTPVYNRYLDGKDMYISGWALNPSGIKEVKVYVNNTYVGNANYGQASDNIKDLYSFYDNSDKSGFKYTIPYNKFSIGSNTIKLVFTGNDGSTEEKSKNIEIYKGENLVVLDTPANKVNGSSINIAGWALNRSGIKNVEVYIDNKFISNANYGIDRPDVNNVYPGYPTGNKSGYNLNLSTDNYMPGQHLITIKAIGVDNSVCVKDFNIVIEKLPNYMSLDNISNNQKFEKNIEILGWALNQSKVKEVNIYLNDKKVGNANYGVIDRPDVNKVFPNYPSGDLSGYYFKLPLNSTPAGDYMLKVVAVGYDGSSNSITKNITIEKKNSVSWIDSPNYSTIINANQINISGWAISAEGINEVKVYIDNVLKGNAQIGILRTDVGKIYPGYINSDHSGFAYTINPSGVLIGQHSVKLEMISNDTSVQTKSFSLNVIDSNPRLWFEDIPNLTKDKNLTITGWALNKLGIREIKVYIDGTFKGNAKYGISRPDVNSTFYGYPQGENSGYSFTSAIGDLAAGKHSVKIIAVSNDSQEMLLEKNFTIDKLPLLFNVDTDFKDYEVIKNKTKLSISGWALNDSGMNYVDLYLDDGYLTRVYVDQLRSDVNSIYPNYPYSINSGFAYSLDIEKLPTGTHTLGLYAVGNDSTMVYKNIHFKISKTVIVIDPGHNYGGDDGAYKTFGSTTYVERDLNMQMALKLKGELEKLGYTIILTRDENDRSKDSASTSLQERADIANNANADLFISLHHDVSSNSSTTGISTHYSTYKPGIDNSGIVDGNDPNGWYRDVNIDTTPSQASIRSRDLAVKLAAGLSSSLGYNNLNAHDHNLFVTVNTNMPSVLIEEGFLSNQTEAQRCADQTQQTLKAQKIAQIVNEYFKTI